MTWTGDNLGRTGAAAIVAAIVSLLVVSGYHPCEGLGPLWVLPPACGVIAALASLPRFTPRAMLVPGLAAASVMGIAIGLDYSSSSNFGPDGVSCEPVPGIAGFALAAVWAGALAAGGLAIAMGLGWLAKTTTGRAAADGAREHSQG